MELAILTVRLGDFSFAMLLPLLIESVEGVVSRPVEISDGVKADMPSAMLSVMAGV